MKTWVVVFLYDKKTNVCKAKTEHDTETEEHFNVSTGDEMRIGKTSCMLSNTSCDLHCKSIFRKNQVKTRINNTKESSVRTEFHGPPSMLRQRQINF